MAEQLLGAHKNKIASLEIVPSGGGCFEVSRDGKKIFSKLETGRFPEYDEINAQLA